MRFINCATDSDMLYRCVTLLIILIYVLFSNSSFNIKFIIADINVKSFREFYVSTIILQIFTVLYSETLEF